jgi:hypothetical protein
MSSVVFKDMITMMLCHVMIRMMSCYVMGSAVFEDINNIYSLGLNEKLSHFFVCHKSPSITYIGFIPSMLTSFALG